MPVTVLPELTYLVAQRLGALAEAELVEDVSAGDFLVEALVPEDLARAATIMRTYADLPIGFVDASTAAMAERLATLELLTTDRRHFSIVRPSHGPAFRLLP